MSFRVSLQSVAVRRVDGAVEDDFKTWAWVTVTGGGGGSGGPGTTRRPLSRVWYTAPDEINLAKTSVTNGWEAAYNFVRSSKPVGELDDSRASELADAEATVHVFKGGHRDAGKDVWLGGVVIHLEKLLAGEKVKGVMTLQGAVPPATPRSSPAATMGLVPPAGATVSPVEYAGTITLDVRADGRLAEYALGGRILRMAGLVMKSHPRRWRLPAAEWEEAEEGGGDNGRGASQSPPAAALLAPPGTLPPPIDHAALVALCDARRADEEENAARYVLSTNLPGGRWLHLATGTLRYHPPPDAALIPSASGAATATPITSPTHRPSSSVSSSPVASARPPAGSTAAPGGAALSPTPTYQATATPGEWSVEWRPTNLFLSKPTATALQAHITAGGMLDFTLRRVLTEPADEDDPVDTVWGLDAGRRLLEEDYAYRGKLSLALDALMAAGATTVHAEVSVEPVTVGEDDKAADAVAKAARDAVWADHMAAKAKAGGGKGGVKKAAAGAKAGGKEVGKGGGGAGGSGGAGAKPGGKEGGKPSAAGGGGGVAGKGGKSPVRGGKGGKEEASTAEVVAATPPPHPYLAAGTFLVATVTVNTAFIPRPITPPPPKVTASDLVSARPAALPAPPGRDASQAFRRTVANAVVAIASQYADTTARAAEGEAVAASSAVTEEGRRGVLAALKSSGMYDALKATLKSSVADVVRERFAAMPGASDPPGTRGHDVFVSHLYAYLIGHMHAALNAATSEAEAVAAVAPALTHAPAGVEALRAAVVGGVRGGAVEGDGEPAHLRRIALECEWGGHLARAERVLQTRVAREEEAAARGARGGQYDVSGWLDLGSFYARRGRLVQAATCLKEVLTIDARCLPALIGLAAVQYQRWQLGEAAVFAETAVAVVMELGSLPTTGEDDDATPAITPEALPYANAAPLVHGLACLIAQAQGKVEDAGVACNHAVAACAALYSHHGVGGAEVDAAATPAAVYLVVARYLLSLHLNQAARQALACAGDALVDTDAPRCQSQDLALLRARWYLQTMRVTQPIPLLETSGGATTVTGDDDATSRLTTTAGGMEVTVSPTGVAYDHAPVTPVQCRDCLDGVCEGDPSNAEAWYLRGVLTLSGLLHVASPPTAATSSDGDDTGTFPLPPPCRSAPDLADLDVADLHAGTVQWRMAVGTMMASTPGASPPLPQVPGYATFLDHGRGSFSHRAQTSPEASIRSSSGVGGGWLGDAGVTPLTAHLSLATLYLHLATREDANTIPATGGGSDPWAGKPLAAARTFFLHAADLGGEGGAANPAPPSTSSSSSGASPLSLSSAWAVALLGLGRVTWAEGDASGAEALLSQANTLDNQNPVVWAWLAYVCLQATPTRDREAAASVEQALKLGLVGDSNESTTLLTMMAERYEQWGHMGVAINLLRRAVVHTVHPASVTHLESMLEAGTSLGRALAADGRMEEAVSTLRAVATHAMPRVNPAHTGALAAAGRIRAIRSSAAAAAAALLSSHGRAAEAAAIVAASDDAHAAPAGGAPA